MNPETVRKRQDF